MNNVKRIDAYLTDNKGKLTRLGSLIYIVIEGVAVAVAQYFETDATTGAIIIPEKFQTIVFYTEILKMVYICWLELLFGAIMIETWKRQLYDGFQLSDIPPMLLSLVMTVIVTASIFFIFLLSTGYVNWTPDWFERPLSPTHLTTMILITLSLLVNILVILLQDKDDYEERDARIAARASSSKKPKGDDKDSKEYPPEGTLEDVLTPKGEVEKKDLVPMKLIKPEWSAPYTDHIFPLLQRMNAKAKETFTYDSAKVKAMTEEEVARVFEFIKKGGSMDDQIERGKVALASMTIIDDMEALRGNTDLIVEWGK